MTTSGPSEILPHLFVGPAIEATRILKKNPYEIKRVIAVIETPFNQGLEKKVEAIMRLHMHDSMWSSLSENFKRAFDFIDRALLGESNILVHCSIGENRSVSLVIAYLMSRKQMSFEEAHDFMKEKHKATSLSPDFLQALSVYEPQFTSSKL